MAVSTSLKGVFASNPRVTLERIQGFLAMKTTFSHFPGIFESPASAVKNKW